MEIYHPFLIRQGLPQGTNARKVFLRCTHFCTVVYCLWAEKLTQDGCHSLTWNPFSQKKIYEIFWS